MKTYKEFLNESQGSPMIRGLDVNLQLSEGKWDGFKYNIEINGTMKDFKKVSNSDFQRFAAGVEALKGGKVVVHGENSNSLEFIISKAFGDNSEQMKALKAKMRSMY